MLDLNKEIKYIKGVGPARATLLNKIRNIYIKRFNNILSKRL